MHSSTPKERYKLHGLHLITDYCPNIQGPTILWGCTMQCLDHTCPLMCQPIPLTTYHAMNQGDMRHFIALTNDVLGPVQAGDGMVYFSCLESQCCCGDTMPLVPFPVHTHGEHAWCASHKDPYARVDNEILQRQYTPKSTSLERPVAPVCPLTTLSRPWWKGWRPCLEPFNALHKNNYNPL